MLADAGVSRVNISLDSLDAAEYARITRGGDLAAALRGIDAAIDAGLTPIKLNAVLAYGLDSGRIERLAALTKNPGIHVRFIELMPIGRSASWAQGKFVPGAAVLQALPGLEPVGADGVAEIYRLPGAEGTIGVIHPISRHFCPICNRVRVTADGRLKPCLHSDKEVALKGLHGEELELAMRLGIEGKPARHRLDKEKVSASRRGMNAIGG
jgi:cyclic pyranopterin phosphate synthase